jgi:hypothetical protein
MNARMKRPLGLAAAAISLAGLTACASASAKVATTSVPPPTTPLATSLVTTQGGWATMVMGGSAANENNFWQLIVRLPGASTWSLVTPPGVADNGGLVAAGSATSLLIGFRPSQDLAFSPLASSGNVGKTWATGLLNAALASVPDALSIGTGGQDLALLSNGTVDVGSANGSWSTLTTLKALAASAPGRACGLQDVTAVSFWGDGSYVVAGDCTRAGVVGVFRDTDGTWEAAGPELPAAYAGQPVRVLRLSGTTVLLQAGPDLLATWLNGTQWSVPQALTDAGTVQSSGFGPGDATAWVLLSDGRAATIINGSSQGWSELPRVPAGTAVLAAPGPLSDPSARTAALPTGGNRPPGPTGAWQALAASGKRLTVWTLEGASWTKKQVIEVPIQYGSSS